MNIKTLNEKLEKILEMSISRQEYNDLEIKDEKMSKALKNLADKIPMFIKNDGETLYGSWRIDYDYNKIYASQESDLYIKFKLLTQGRLNVIYHLPGMADTLPRYMDKYVNSVDTYGVIYNLHKENLSSVVSDTISNVKNLVSFRLKKVKENNKENARKSKEDAKLNAIIEKYTSKLVRTLGKTQTNRNSKNLPINNNLYRQVLINMVKIPQGKLIGLGIDMKSNLYGFIKGESDWKNLTNILSSKEQQAQYYPIIFDSLQVVVGDNLGNDNLKREQTKIARAEEKERLKKEKREKELLEKCSDAVYYFRSLMRNASSGDYRSIEKNGSDSYEFDVRDWGEWGTDRDWENDNDFMELQDRWESKLERITQNVNSKYKKYDLKAYYYTNEKRWMTCGVTFGDEP